jgi:hypothetical protein
MRFQLPPDFNSQARSIGSHITPLPLSSGPGALVSMRWPRPVIHTMIRTVASATKIEGIQSLN